MIHLEAISTLGEGLRASGRTRAEAEANMIRAIERQSGMRFVQKHGADVAEFAPPEAFAELPPKGDCCHTICLPAKNGRLSCTRVCRCKDQSRCSCGTTNFSESNKMPLNLKKPRRRFDETDADVEQLRQQLTDLIKDAPLALLQKLAEACAEQDDQPQDAEEERFCELASGASKFSEKKHLNPSQKDYLRAFRAERRVNPNVCAEDWFPKGRR